MHINTHVHPHTLTNINIKTSICTMQPPAADKATSMQLQKTPRRTAPSNDVHAPRLATGFALSPVGLKAGRLTDYTSTGYIYACWTAILSSSVWWKRRLLTTHCCLEAVVGLRDIGLGLVCVRYSRYSRVWVGGLRRYLPAYPAVGMLVWGDTVLGVKFLESI